MFPFKSKSEPIIGLDISSTAVKLLQLSGGNGRYRVEHYAVEPLPVGSVEQSSINQPEAVGNAIARALKKSGSKAKQAAIAVAGSAVITKIITMPAELTDSELEGQIQLEAGQHIPYPLDEVSLDFEVIGPVDNNPEAMNVLLAASRTENVDTRIAAAEIGGLSVKIVDVEAFATANSYELIADNEGISSDEMIAVIDIGASLTAMNIIHDGQIIYTREQGFGGKQLTEEIMRVYGLSYEEAGQAKKQGGGLPNNYEEEVLNPFKESLVQQVSRSLQFFFSSSEHDSVSRVVLAGGCATIPGIETLAEEQIGIPVSIANPLAGMTSARKINNDTLMEDSPALIIACGLALRSFDQ